MANVVVVGSQWGDEGKGKIVDWLSERADVVVRYQGGHNAGHTLVIDGVSYKLALLPSGLVQGKLSAIGNGVVVDPHHFVTELERLRAQGVAITPEILRIADNAPLILSLHRELDAIREDSNSGLKIGTTKRGIGYEMRPIRPDDEAAIVSMLQRSSRDDIRLRFFAPRSDFGHSFAARLTQVDYDREMAFVALEPGSTEISGVVRLIAAPDNDKGEFAVMVRSDLKGTGLGSLLMTEILGYARDRGIAKVEGEVLRENTSMLRLVRALGFTVQSSPDDPTVVHVSTTALPD